MRGHGQGRLRPGLILSQDVFSARSGTVIAEALTSPAQAAGFPLTLELAPGRLRQRSWVKISQIGVLAGDRIDRRLGRATPEEMARVVEGLNDIVGC